MTVTGEIQSTQRICPCNRPTTETGLRLNLGLHSNRPARVEHYNAVTSTLPAATCLLPFVSPTELLAVVEIILLLDDVATSVVLVLRVAFPPTRSIKTESEVLLLNLTMNARNITTT